VREDEPNTHAQTLNEEFSSLMMELHSVVPGVLTLFGFQLMVSFNDVFSDELPPHAHWLHVVALLALAGATAIVMAPAAYHRLGRPGEVTNALVRRFSGLVGAALIPVGLVFTIDVYMVTRLVLANEGLAIAAAVLAAVLFLALWIVLPLRGRNERE
jgi:uncharacterized protein DUF6328